MPTAIFETQMGGFLLKQEQTRLQIMKGGLQVIIVSTAYVKGEYKG